MDRDTIEQQRILNQVKANMASQTPPPSASIQTFGQKCPECGLLHPPLPAGKRCPNAKENLDAISDVEINKFLATMKTILVSQIKKKEIKDGRKLFQFATIELTKLLESYTE